MPATSVLLVCFCMAAVCGELTTALAGSYPVAGQKPKPETIHFTTQIQPILAQYCYPCHGEKKKGDLDFRVYTDESSARGDRKVFEKILSKLESHEMPPENKPQPTESERALVTNWVARCFFECDCNHPDPGRITIRRLNRAEYNNTVRDLLGIEFRPADDFPSDDSGYGFDNIGDVLSLSPVLVEKYLAASEQIAEAVFTNSTGASSTAVIPKAKPGEARKRLILDRSTPIDNVDQVITNFAAHAFRRPLTPAESARLKSLFHGAKGQGESSEPGLKLVIEAVLVSPQFLFRGDAVNANDRSGSLQSEPVDEYALASRLSYFLWSSMPDDELFAQAARHTLHRNLEKQVRRMLQDPKARALVENFAGQWLQLRNLKLATPDPKQFPEFDEALRSAIQRETELCFDYICRENRSVLEFIDADYTFLNERLAGFYHLPGIKGDGFRRVALTNKQRGGVLTQASFLTITSNPTRTSPVKRGKWVLENILGTPPPPPPPNVPELKEGKAALTGSLRQRMEQHRADPNCAACHARMDPIGFGFEHYDGTGAWREREGEFTIDASGKLLSGESFTGPGDLKALLVNQKRPEFVRCLAAKMLTYALGRGLEYYDKCALDRIVKNLASDHYHFQALVIEIVKSTPFRMKRTSDAGRYAVTDAN